MTYEMYHSIFVAAGILGGIMLSVTILLFFVLKIPGLFGYFTGAAKKKAVEDMRQQNEGFDSSLTVDHTSVSEKTEVRGESGLSGHLSEETLVLSVSDRPVLDETSVLSSQERRFEVEYEICYIHSSEIIG